MRRLDSRVTARARSREDRAGDPLDGLVNLFDIGIVLSVAFLLAALSSLDLTSILTDPNKSLDQPAKVAPDAVVAEEQVEPLIVEPEEDDPESAEMAAQLGMGWAMGFIAGMTLREDAWQAWVTSEGGDEDLKLIERLAGEEAGAVERKGLVDELPSLLEDCAGFWRGATREVSP